MARKKKVFSKVKAVKDAARTAIGPPRSTRAIPNPKRKAEAGEKHRKPAGDWMEEQ